MSCLVILHTNDLHNRLIRRPERAARLRDLVQQERDGVQDKFGTCPDGILLLDAGDAVGAGNLTYTPGGEPILDIMSDLGYNAMTIGNREFHFTETGFISTLNRARFPILCANIRSRGDARLPVQSHVIMDTSVGRVGIFGLTVPLITERMLSQHVSAYVFDDPIHRGCEVAEELRSRADLLIALTHIGLTQDVRLAQSTGAIDLIVGGHSHSVLEQPLWAGGVPIVQAGCHARYLGRVEVQLDAPVRVKGQLIPLLID
ncbi:MAG: metallophosphatase [Armatimonadota bacterium]|nr:metallophosphatase [bacterium]MDW8321602.1 metallophosphatase [Armatimonadota bacterium]